MGLIWILLPIAVLVGWFAAKRDNANRQRFLYYLSLRYLLGNENTVNDDKTMPETLSELPPSYQDNTVLLSLTLGDVFRNKGEIDRAITIHSHIAQSDLIDSSEKNKAKWSLALDFIAAGLLDRAEVILRELIEFSEFTQNSLLKLAHIYEQQRDWLQAISCLERLEIKDLYISEISHLYCELAEEAIKKTLASITPTNSLIVPSFESATTWANIALNYYPNSARASLTKAFIAIYQKEDAQALKSLHLIESQSPALAPLIAPLMQYLTQKTPILFIDWLNRNLTLYPHIHLVLMKTHYLIENQSSSSALQYLEDTLIETPNLQGLLNFHHLSALLSNKSSLSISERKPSIDVYEKTFAKVIDHYARYRCEHCGFVSKSLNWHCPSCQSWDTAFPVIDIISLKGTVSSPGA